MINEVQSRMDHGYIDEFLEHMVVKQSISDRGSFAKLDTERSVLRIVVRKRVPADKKKWPAELPLDKSIAGEAARKKAIIEKRIEAIASGEPGVQLAEDGELHFKEILCIPVLMDEKVYGVLNFHNDTVKGFKDCPIAYLLAEIGKLTNRLTGEKEVPPYSTLLSYEWMLKDKETLGVFEKCLSRDIKSLLFSAFLVLGCVVFEMAYHQYIGYVGMGVAIGLISVNGMINIYHLRRMRKGLEGTTRCTETNTPT